MSEFIASPKHLKRLFEHTHQTLRLYYNKNKWSAIYPTLSQLAERFVKTYHAQPNAMHAHLQFYASDQGYTTNLTVNQCILVCAFCSAHGYDEYFTEELIIAALSDHLCCSNETNKMARGARLSPQENKLIKLRHQFAIKMLDSANVPQGQLQRILSRLDPYSKALTGTNFIPLYDNTSILVALAKRIAKAITPRPNAKTFNIVQAIKSLYLGTHSHYAHISLMALAKQVAKFPGGGLVRYKGQSALVLSADHNGYVLALLNNNQAMGMLKTRRKFSPVYKPITTGDKTLLFSIWFSEQVPSPIYKTTTSMDAWQAVTKLGKEQFLEFKPIERAIKPFPQVIEALQMAARQYNRQGQKASTLRHCLTMVGLDTAGLLCQRVLLETLISQLNHPFASDIWHKYTHINKVIVTLLSRTQSELFEFLLSPFTMALYFILSNHACEIMRKVKPCHEDIDDTPISTARVFGFNQFNIDQFSEFTNTYFKHSTAHQALLASEHQSKSSLDKNAQTLVVVKLLCIYTLGGAQKLSPWQQQVIDDVLAQFEWPCLAAFYEEFMSHSPSCCID